MLRTARYHHILIWSDLLSDLPEEGNALSPTIDPRLEVVLREPIFTVQHTRFGCGSVVKLLLVVSDADGYFQLMRDLAELYRDIKDGGTSAGSSTSYQGLHVAIGIR